MPPVVNKISMNNANINLPLYQILSIQSKTPQTMSRVF